MITTKYVRDNIEQIRDSLARRKSDYPLDELVGFDERIRKLKTAMQELQAKRNRESLEVSAMKKEGKDASGKIAELGKTKEEIDSMEKQLAELEERADYLLWNMPNILDKS